MDIQIELSPSLLLDSRVEFYPLAHAQLPVVSPKMRTVVSGDLAMRRRRTLNGGRTHQTHQSHCSHVCNDHCQFWSLKMAGSVQMNVQRNSGLVFRQSNSVEATCRPTPAAFVVTHQLTGSSTSQLPSSRQADVSVPNWTWEGVLQRSNLPVGCLCTLELLCCKFYKSQKHGASQLPVTV